MSPHPGTVVTTEGSGRIRACPVPSVSPRGEAVHAMNNTMLLNRKGLRLRAVTLAVLLAGSLMVVGGGTAGAAATHYFPCPITAPGAGCGVSGSVGPGKYLAEFTFAGPEGYDFEPFVDQCPTACPVFNWAVGREDRTPAGFQVTSDSPFTLSRMLP